MCHSCYSGDKRTRNILKTIVFALILSILLIMPATASAQTRPSLNVTDIDGTTNTLPSDYLFTLPKTIVYAELYCYGNLVTTGYWGGVKLSDLLSQVGDIDEQVNSVYFEAQDGYKAYIPIKTTLRGDVLIAYEKDGMPLPESPRLVIPNTNGNLWIALIISITLSTQQIAEGASGAGSSPVNIPFTPSQQALTQSPPQTQPTPTMQPDNGTMEPVTPPENITQQDPAADNDTIKQPDSRAYSLDFGVESGYLIALTAILAVTTVMFAVFRRRTRTRTLSKSI